MNLPIRSRSFRSALRSATFLAAAVFLVPGVAQTDSTAALQHKPRPVLAAADLAKRIHAHINEARARHGLPTLLWSDALSRIAMLHSQDMAKRDYLAHDTPEGTGFIDRYQRAGFSCQIRTGHQIYTGAENIALGRLYNRVTTSGSNRYYDWNTEQTIARRVVDGWLNSPGHRKNIMSPHWRYEGIGVEIHRDNKVYVTQNFC